MFQTITSEGIVAAAFTRCDGGAHPTLGNKEVPWNRPSSPAGNSYPAARQRGGMDRLVLNQSCLLSQRVVGQH